VPIKINKHRWRQFFLMTMLFWSSALAAETATAITIISNASVDRNELQLKEIRAIFTMKKRLWSDGQRIQVYVLNAKQSAHTAFCKSVLGVFPRQLDAIWQRRVYSGTGQAPITLNSHEEMLNIIATTPGAIGYIEQQENISVYETINTISVLR